MIPHHALVREPGTHYPGCISSHPLKSILNISLARKQHKNYCKTLEELGLELIRLPRDNRPDSCFVEDNAVIHGKKALITRMGAENRRGEEESVAEVLGCHLEVEKAVAPATVEGGDIIHLPDRLISGITQRTNPNGVAQVANWLDVKITTITDPSIIHLKSYITYLGNDIMITTEKYTNHPVLEKYQLLIVPEDENYAANTLSIGETVLMASGYPLTRMLVTEAGFEVVSLDMSEFQKCEGALTCLSLLF